METTRPRLLSKVGRLCRETESGYHRIITIIEKLQNHHAVCITGEKSNKSERGQRREAISLKNLITQILHEIRHQNVSEKT